MSVFSKLSFVIYNSNVASILIYFNFDFDYIVTADWPLLTYCSFSCSFVNEFNLY